MNDDVWLELVRRVKDPEFAAELVKVLQERAEAERLRNVRPGS